MVWRTCGNRTRLPFRVPGEKEQAREADLLDVEADKDVADRFWVELTPGFGRWRRLVDPQKQVLDGEEGSFRPAKRVESRRAHLVHKPEEPEAEKCKTTDQWSDDGVCEPDDRQERD